VPSPGLRRRKRYVAGLGAGALLTTAAAGAARAADRDPTLEWQAPPECPDAAYVMRRWAANRLAATRDAALDARAVVVRGSDGLWRVELSIDGRSSAGHRSMVAASCLEAAEAVALVLAMASDAEPAKDASRAAAAPAVAEAPVAPVVATEDPRPVAPLPPPDDPSESPAPISRPEAFAVSTQAFVDIGILPSPGPGLAVTVTWFPATLRSVWIELGGALSGIESTGNSEAERARFSLRAAALGACVGPRGARWRAGACADLEAVALHGAAEGETDARSDDGGLTELRARWSIAYDLAWPWEIRADGSAGLAVSVPQFVLVGPDATTTTLYTPSRWSARLALGVAVHF
jgi:hypothetical protein